MKNSYLELKRGQTLNPTEKRLIDKKQVNICKASFIQTTKPRRIKHSKHWARLMKSDPNNFLRSNLSHSVNTTQPRILLLQLSHINFTVLKDLFLFRSKMESIEPIARMQMPALKQLLISNWHLIETTTASPASTPSGSAIGLTSKISSSVFVAMMQMAIILEMDTECRKC